MRPEEDGTRSDVPLSVILPAYGSGTDLSAALASIADQDVVPAAVIVVDDGSVPPLHIPEEAAAELPVQLVRRALNGGAAAARNAGMAVCQTDWATFLDCDDRLEPGTLGARWREVAEDQARFADPLAFYGCSWRDIDVAGRTLGIRDPRPSTGPGDFAAGCWFSPGSCIIINVRAAVAAAGFQDEELRRLEDYDWFLALALKGFHLKTSPLIGTAIRRVRRRAPDRITASATWLTRKWRRAGADRTIMRRLEAYLALEAAAAHYFAGNHVHAALWMVRSLLAWPRLSLQFSPSWQRQDGPASRWSNDSVKG